MARRRRAAAAGGRLRSQVELELKYDAADLAALADWFDLHHPAAEGAGWQDIAVTDRYVDTANDDLARAGYGTRLRRSGRATTVGLKSDQSVAGARHRRTEIEAPATASLDARQWPPSAARELVLEHGGEARLVERFSLRQRRRERAIELGGSSLLVSLDDARVLAGGRTLGRLRGIEVELRGGRRRGLRQVERQLGESGLVSAQPLSKMQLAQALVAAHAALQADDTFAEAGRKILARHLARMLDRAPVARRGHPLGLKQMRVATRRMRSVWRVFDGAYRRSARRRYVAELRALADRLGAVRDLDVLLERLPDEPALRPLAEAWRAAREQRMRDLIDHLDSAAYVEFVADYRRFVGTPGAATGRRLPDARLADATGDRVRAAYEHVMAFGPSLADADEATLHALRIAGKRLRYTFETFAELLPEAPFAHSHRRLVALQDALGALNDAAVAAARAEEWLGEHGDGALAATRDAVGAYVAGQRSAIAARRREAIRRWSGVAGVGFARDMARLTNP